ncbi:hypothetical protein H257_02574 [Aphanomyces astaci]|uniref:Uncharacterized protein n=1 Tax=Aphanomyces astaci TaxID=112090 RepID=W4H4Q1_APHAT|nr:hypothetical protein H257_02574 [Aphanomyces astaci]ETV86108.1 hypothetical protein H257_02574 [Aphanomyces astaci]|eukprot:XP_009824580.1 hypothetical protein H257_02574 [Aphanomyces astaci]
MVSDDADDLGPRTTAPPAQHPAPRYPLHTTPKQQHMLRARRLDADFLNPERTLHFAHQVDTVVVDTGGSHTQKQSTTRLEHEIQRLIDHAPSLDSFELESVDRQDIMRHLPPPNTTGRYDASQLVPVDAPVPVKPRQVRKQVSEAWKKAHAVAPSIELHPEVNYDLESCIVTPLVATDDPFFLLGPSAPTISNDPPRYLNESVVYFSST